MSVWIVDSGEHDLCPECCHSPDAVIPDAVI